MDNGGQSLTPSEFNTPTLMCQHYEVGQLSHACDEAGMPGAGVGKRELVLIDPESA
jgi:hypothetical protein